MGARPMISFLKSNTNVEKSEQDETEIETNNENIETKELTAEEAVSAFKEDYARKLGWTPKQDWETAGRDPNLWRGFEDFLENSPTYFDRLRKKSREQEVRMKRNAQAAAAAVEEATRKTREEAEREAREAATSGDPDRAAAAVAKAANAGPPPETVAWISRNAWFDEDPEARAVAAAAVDRAAKSGATISEQLEAAETSVKKRFPEYFDEDELPDFITKSSKRTEAQEEEPKREVRMSESSRVAAAAQSGSATSARNRDSRANKEKSFKDIPGADQKLYQQHFARKFQGRGLTVEQAQEKYAKSYFENKI